MDKKAISKQGDLVSKQELKRYTPNTGWKPHTWYLVEVAYSSTNPVHRAVLFTGFLNDDGSPGAYRFLTNVTTPGEDSYSRVKYLNPIREIISKYECDPKFYEYLRKNSDQSH